MRSPRGDRVGSPIGDASYEHGDDIPMHETHEGGLDVDIRPIRDAGPVHAGDQLAFATYNRAATRELVQSHRTPRPAT